MRVPTVAGTALTLTTMFLGLGGQARAATPSFATTGAETHKSCQMLTQPIYEADAPSGKVAFSTTKGDVSQGNGEFNRSKGIAFYASSTAGPGLESIHRLYNVKNNDYLYVPEGKEMTSAMAKYGYGDQGIVFYASKRADDCNAPMQRAMLKGGHAYTHSESTYDSLVTQGWVGEGKQFYVNTRPVAFSQQLYTDYTPAIAAYKAETDPRRKLADYQIAITPTSTWISGPSDNARLQSVMSKAEALGQTPQITLYGIPGRDCKGDSAGGLADARAYDAWVGQVSSIIGKSRAILIVEPDAVSYCSLPAGDPARGDRENMLKNVGSTFAANNPNTASYLHLGSGDLSQYGGWQAVKNLDFDNFTGFAMGVSSLGGTVREETWGEKFVQTLNSHGIMNKPYIVDTSRNGVDQPDNVPGASFEACDNPRAALGHRPSIHTSAEHDNAWLWVKHPGVSDGVCNIGGLRAGTWDGAYAVSLMNNAITTGSTSIIQPPS